MGGSSEALAGGRLPTFLLIGAQKAGTTSLHRYLREHPQVFMPRHKEPNFFVAEYNWGRGLDWYQQWFQPGSSAVALGEASTRYTMYPMHDGVPERVAATLSEPRLIYIVRDPIQRMVSNYVHLVANGTTTAPLEQALLGDPTYLNTSRYGLQLERYLAYFPPEQILVVVSEQLRANREETLARVFAFLGVDTSFQPPSTAEEYNLGTNQRAPRALLRPLTRVPGWYRMTGAIPKPLKLRVRKLTRKPVARPELSPALRRELTARLHDDVAMLRHYAPPGFDGWGIG